MRLDTSDEKLPMSLEVFFAKNGLEIMSNTGKSLAVKLGGDNDDSQSTGLRVTVQGRPVDNSAKASVDLVFVIDTTGSMSDKIEGLLNTCTKFVDEFASLRLDHRIAIVAFGDLTVTGDRIVATKFTNNLETTKESLAKIPRYSGGGNEGESSFDAMDKAMARPFRQDAVKVLVLITDEPGLEHDNITAKEITRRLGQEEFLTFVVATPDSYYKEMAEKNGGKWYEVSASSDFTDLLDTFREMAKKVSIFLTEVHKLGKGSVKDYLRLKASE